MLPVINAIDPCQVMNYPTSIMWKYCNLHVDLHCVIKTNLQTYKEVLKYYQVVSCYTRTSKVCNSCFYHDFPMPWMILQLFTSVGVTQACPNKAVMYMDS